MGFTAVNVVKGDSRKRPPKSCRMLRKIEHPEPHSLTTSLAPNQASLPNPFAFVQQKTRANPPLDAHFLRKPVSRAPGPPRTQYEGTAEAPTLYPTIEELNCPQAFLNSLTKYAHHGMVKIVAPKGMDHPRFSADSETFTIRSRHQLVNQTLSSEQIHAEFAEALQVFHLSISRGSYKAPLIHKKPLNMYLLFRSVQQRGGMHEISRRKLWQQIGREMGYSGKIMSSLSTTLRVAYQKLLQPFSEYLAEHKVDVMNRARLARFRVLPYAEPKEGEYKLPCGILVTCDFSVEGQSPDHIPEVYGAGTSREIRQKPNWRRGRYGVLNAAEQAPSYNLKQFQLKAQAFESLYFGNSAKPSTSEVEAEYWRLLQSRDECVSVEYGYSMTSASASPKGWSSPWSPENLAQADGSYMNYIDNEMYTKSSLDMGMLFATKCWTAEPYLSAMCSYSYMGAPRTWYSVAPENFEQMVGVLTPRDNVQMMTPQQLRRKGIKVYAIDQYAGELVIIFPKSWHAHFNHGFNVCEKNYYMQGPWLEAGRQCLIYYNTLKLRAPFPWEQFVLNAAKSDDLGVLKYISEELARLADTAVSYERKFTRSSSQFQAQVCVKTNQVLCLHYVDTANGPVNPEFAEVGDGELVTFYEGVGFFHDLIEQINQKFEATRDFARHVSQCLVSQRRHSVAKLKALKAFAPSTNRAQSLAKSLDLAADGVLTLPNNSADALAELILLYSKSVCASPQLDDILQSRKHYATFVAEFERFIEKSYRSAEIVEKLGEYLAQLKTIQIPNQLLGILNNLYDGILWAQRVVPQLNGLLFYEQIEGLLAEAARFQIPHDCLFIQLLLQRRQAGFELRPAAEQVAMHGGADAEQVRQIILTANYAAIEQPLYARLALLHQMSDVVQKMMAKDFRERPRYSAVVQYRHMHQQLGWAILQCEKWFQAFGYAPQLLAQADAAQRGVDLPNCLQVNLQVALPLLDQVYLLQVMPDNLEQFLQASATIRQFVGTGRSDILQKYGFV